jgi:hypothetical protein
MRAGARRMITASREGTRCPAPKDDRAMKGLIVAIGVLVVLVLLTSSGVLGGAICLNNVGCLYSDSNGISVDNSESVTVTTGNP